MKKRAHEVHTLPSVARKVKVLDDKLKKYSNPEELRKLKIHCKKEIDASESWQEAGAQIDKAIELLAPTESRPIEQKVLERLTNRRVGAVWRRNVNQAHEAALLRRHLPGEQPHGRYLASPDDAEVLAHAFRDWAAEKYCEALESGSQILEIVQKYLVRSDKLFDLCPPLDLCTEESCAESWSQLLRPHFPPDVVFNNVVPVSPIRLCTVLGNFGVLFKNEGFNHYYMGDRAFKNSSHQSHVEGMYFLNRKGWQVLCEQAKDAVLDGLVELVCTIVKAALEELKEQLAKVLKDSTGNLEASAEVLEAMVASLTRMKPGLRQGGGWQNFKGHWSRHTR